MTMVMYSFMLVVFGLDWDNFGWSGCCRRQSLTSVRAESSVNLPYSYFHNSMLFFPWISECGGGKYDGSYTVVVLIV